MAYDTLVDGEELTSAITEIADAVRTRRGEDVYYAFPTGMANAIKNIPHEEVYKSEYLAVGDGTKDIVFRGIPRFVKERVTIHGEKNVNGWYSPAIIWAKDCDNEVTTASGRVVLLCTGMTARKKTSASTPADYTLGAIYSHGYVISSGNTFTATASYLSNAVSFRYWWLPNSDDDNDFDLFVTLTRLDGTPLASTQNAIFSEGVVYALILPF